MCMTFMTKLSFSIELGLVLSYIQSIGFARCSRWISRGWIELKAQIPVDESPGRDHEDLGRSALNRRRFLV